MEGVKDFFKNLINFRQIWTLLWKEIIIRKRQPWMTAIQYIWPCAVFLSIYLLRIQFKAYTVDDCQFPTRQLPTKSDILPFFQSYICTIDNECTSPNHYEEIDKFSDAPITPVMNIVQTFLNDESLYNAVVDLPNTTNFLGLVTTVASSSKFNILEENIKTIQDNWESYMTKIDGVFNADILWTNYETFRQFGSILCGKPFSGYDSIRFIERTLNSEDFNGVDPNELAEMPTQYCKDLYVHVTSSNNGKMTWTEIKPIIHGKIIYGPQSPETDEIIKFANGTFEGMARLKTFVHKLNTIVIMLRTNDDFRNKLSSLINLAKSPFVSQIIKSFSIDPAMLDVLYNTIVNEETVATITRTADNILECFNVNRFVPVSTEHELEELAYKLNDRKLFYGGVYFNISNETSESPLKDYSYTLRMEIDNTPVTDENRNRFWFPGPQSSFELDMRYHRGFIQIQHNIDQGIIKTAKHAKDKIEKEKAAAELKRKQEEMDRTSTTTTTTTTTTTEIPLVIMNTEPDQTTEPLSNETTETHVPAAPSQNSTPASANNLIDLFLNFLSTGNGTSETKTESNNTKDLDGTDLDDFLNFDDDDHNYGDHASTNSSSNVHLRRRKRSPQFGNLLGLLFGSSSSKNLKATDELTFNVDEFHSYTKEFPYPKYERDGFKTGTYLSQAVQFCFFFASIIQIAAAVRSRIWFRESGNFILMQIMGLRKSSEWISWYAISIIEIFITFIICIGILFAEGILRLTSLWFLAYFMFLFGTGIIAFCYLMSNIFTSASIGSVSSVILFLLTFCPYIIIIALGTTVSFGIKLLTSLSIATPFCYIWQSILRLELQNKELTFIRAHTGFSNETDIGFGIFMMFVDIILYTLIGYFYERYFRADFKFHKVSIRNMDKKIGAAMENVTKIYDEQEQQKRQQQKLDKAVDNVSIVLKRNEITCFLGRNGAGKSTIIKLLTGQIAPTTGTVYWPQNLDYITGNESRDKIGLCPQNVVLIPNLTAKEHLELYANIKLDQRHAAEVNRVMKSLNFGIYEKFQVENLSGGYQRRLNVAIAFIGSPNLVILDEPCSGVDAKTRKNIWELISILKQGRAVVLATHYLDEAEHLSDNILILNDGKIVSENSPETLREQFTKSFDLHIRITFLEQTKTIEEIKDLFDQNSCNFTVLKCDGQDFVVNIPYYNAAGVHIHFGPMFRTLESLKTDKKIDSFKVISKDLEGIFNSINHKTDEANLINDKDNDHVSVSSSALNQPNITEWKIIKTLLWKRFKHFRRNLKIIVSVLLLPLVFEIFAMTLMQIQAPDPYGNSLELNRNLYPNSTEFYSFENTNSLNADIEQNLHCDFECDRFNDSASAFRWVLNTTDEYIRRRYGGISINQSMNAVWFNNKGYHSMPVYLNELNTAKFKAELNDSDYNIRTFNHPIKLGREEISTSSILQQSANAGISVILLIAFSYVIAGCSIYTVNERISGEKLQQRLSGVSFRTYWGVAFVWDLIVYTFALALCAIVLFAFNIPVYTAKDNLAGICLILFLFGFATIPMVHLCEKLFTDASLASMHILCMNITIAMTTVMTILIIDILGDSDESDLIRHILNSIFMILPQHALSDGLVQICRNYITSIMFERFYIDTYKSPIKSDLLLPNYVSLIVFGIVFMIINYIVENNLAHSWLSKVFRERDQSSELQNITTLSNGTRPDDKYDFYAPKEILKVSNLKKIYNGNHQAIQDISFQINTGECFGLLGANGAGKSTMFSILSGQLRQTSGSIELLGNKKMSYCPQSNALDSLLTVQEVIYFYATLKNAGDVNEITQKTLSRFHLAAYKNTLVRNLSGGNRRKLSVAITCFGNSSLILMDEPTSDMDPVTRSLVYTAINRLISEKRSVILTSHTMTEIDRVCHRIGVLKDGKMLSIGTPANLKQTFGNSYLVTIFFDETDALNIERAVKIDIPNVDHLMVHNHCLQFTVKIKPTETDISQECHTDGILLSELFDKLHSFVLNRNVTFTLSECLLNQALERILDPADHGAYSNPAYHHTESIT